LRNVQQFNIAASLCHLGRYSEAADLVAGIRSLAQELGDGADLAKLGWLEGLIAAGTGRREEARRLLEEAWVWFERHEMWCDAALARMELTAPLLEEGRTAEVKEIAGKAYELFKREGIGPEALGAVLRFLEAVRKETATSEQARRLVLYLYRARHDQGLHFDL
jgi:hypothetical protein